MMFCKAQGAKFEAKILNQVHLLTYCPVKMSVARLNSRFWSYRVAQEIEPYKGLL